MKRPAVLVTNYLIPEVIDAAADRFEVTENYGLEPDELVDTVGGYDALLCRSATKLTPAVIGAGAQGNLKIVASATSGIDHVDLMSAARAGIVVCRTPYGVTNANAEYNIGAMLALSRKFITATHQMQNGVWDQQGVLGHEISERELGLVGFGRIGQRTAKYANAFDMTTRAYDPYVADNLFEDSGVSNASLEEVMAESDFVVVNVPRTDETRGLIGEQELSLMRMGGYIIHVARGGVVAEQPLLDALETNRIAGAAVDVFEGEPAINSRFQALENVILTPHVGCSTIESRQRVGMFALNELSRYFAGLPLECPAPALSITAA